MADLPYAHETVGHYDKVRFFDPADARQLAEFMAELMEGRLTFDFCSAPTPSQPFAENWGDLFERLLTVNGS